MSSQVRTERSTAQKDDGAVIRVTAPAPGAAPELVLARRRRYGRILAGIIPLVLLLLWQLFADAHWVDPRLFSSPTAVGNAAWDLLKSGELRDDLGATCRRVVVGYVIGSLAGIVIGTAAGVSVLATSAFRPLVAAVQTVPMLGVLPVFLLIFGLGETPIYLVTIWGMAVLLSIGTLDAVAGVPTSYLEAAKSLNTPWRNRFIEVIFPASLPRIFTSLRIGIGLAVLSVVGIEFVVADDGIGQLIWKSWNLLLPAQMFVGVICASLIGVVMGSIVTLLERFLIPWNRAGHRIF